MSLFEFYKYFFEASFVRIGRTISKKIQQYFLLVISVCVYIVHGDIILVKNNN